MTENKIVAPFAEFSKIENDIIYIVYKDNFDEFIIDDALEHTRILSQITHGIPSLLLLDYSNSTMLYTHEAREYFAKNKDHLKQVKAKAMIVKSIANKLAANFYVAFHKPKIPVQNFKKKSSAIKWLLEQ